jgi:hypothetical protein
MSSSRPDAADRSPVRAGTDGTLEHIRERDGSNAVDALKCQGAQFESDTLLHRQQVELIQHQLSDAIPRRKPQDKTGSRKQHGLQTVNQA